MSITRTLLTGLLLLTLSASACGPPAGVPAAPEGAEPSPPAFVPGLLHQVLSIPVRVLENVRGQVPEPARPAVDLSVMAARWVRDFTVGLFEGGGPAGPPNELPEPTES